MQARVSIERRRYPRTLVSKLAVLEQPDAPTTTAMLVEVSESGAPLRTAVKPDPQMAYVIHFTLDGHKYTASVRVVRWAWESGMYRWGCELRGMTPSKVDQLRKFVYGAAGMPIVRPWMDIRRDCSERPSEQVVIGYRPKGGEIRVRTQDCLRIGAEGLNQFAQSVCACAN